MALSTNKLFFISGNPNYEVHKGVIEFYEDIGLDWALSSGYDNERVKTTDKYKDCRLQCIIAVPSFMIHQEILNYLSAVIRSVRSIFILRHYSDPEQYFVILLMDSLESSHLLVNEFSGRILSTLQPTTCMIYSVKNIYFIQDDSTLLPFHIRDINSKYFEEINNLDGNQKLLLPSKEPAKETVVVEGGEQTSQPTTEPSEQNQNQSEPKEEKSANVSCDEEVICAVCLEAINIENPNCLTTCCNHTFHISCLIPLESSQCPVCRFEHDSTASLSMCSTCSMESTNSTTLHNHVIHDPTDTWVCLVCGYIGCGNRGMNHSQLHYEEQLHAYAMNTETKRVWDYAGEGYVHRLILSRPDNSDSSIQTSQITVSNFGGESKEPYSGSGVGMKIVEVSDPRGPNDGFRSQHPPLTQQQEDYIVNRKLESAAEHYSGMLAWQLEQQREQYEAQLYKLRSFKNNERESESKHEMFQNNRWLHKIEQTLHHERVKLIKQKEAALTRLQRVEQETSLLQEFNRNLEMNSDLWVQKAEEAAKNLNDIETSYRNSVAVLERKVRMLMKKIDNENESTEEKTENEEEKVGSGEKEGVESKENSTTLR